MLIKKLSLCWYVIISVAILSGCATGTFQSSQYYTVQKGDTLSKIAATYNLNYLTLARQNNLQYPYILKVGQSLYVGTPAAGNTNNYANSLPQRTSINTSTQSTVTPVASSTTLSAQTLNLSQYSGPAPKAAKAEPIANSPIDGLKVSTTPTQKSDTVTWAWPVTGTVVQAFGEGSNLLARGVQISVAPKTKVLAAAPGQVIFSGLGAQNYGKMIIIKHGNNLLTAYTGLSKTLVTQGQRVTLGQAIAVSGTINGKSWLHFEIRKFGSPVNPLIYLPVPDNIKINKTLKPISKPKMDSTN